MIHRRTLRPWLLSVAMTILVPSLSASAAITVNGSDFDFGYVPFGSKIKHRLSIVNGEPTTVMITRVQPGCGCTEMPLPRKDIAPGDSLVVELILDTSMIKRGRFQKQPRLYTDNLAKPSITVTLTGYNVDTGDKGSPIRFTPEKLTFGPKAPTEQTIRLTNGSDLDVIARVADLPKEELLTVELPRRLIVKGRNDSLIVKRSEVALEQDVVNESLTLYFNDRERTRVTIPIRLARR